MTAYFIIVAVDKKINTDKVWLCESLGKLKGVGQLEIAKMNELRMHKIADLQLHVCHRERCLFEASTEFMLWLFKLSQGTLLLLSRTTGKRKIRIIRDMERDGWTN